MIKCIPEHSSGMTNVKFQMTKERRFDIYDRSLEFAGRAAKFISKLQKTKVINDRFEIWNLRFI